MSARAYIELADLLKLRYQAQGFSYLPRQPIHSLLSGSRASRLRGRGLNSEELRAYLPGDDIRSIDWKVTARTGKPHTRVYTEERDRPVLMLVDQRINMFFGSELNTKSVTAAEAAAVSAWRVLSVGDRPGALVFNDSTIDSIRPHRSETRVLEMLNKLVHQNHKLNVESRVPENPGQLNEVLKLAASQASHDNLIVLISDLYGADEETNRLAARLAEHNDVLVLFIYDSLEANLPEGGKLVISDGDLQMQVDTSETGLREKFNQDFEERFQRAKNLLLRRQVPVMTLQTSRPVIDQVREQLGQLPNGRVA